MSRGFYGLAVYQPKNIVNTGTLWRSGFILGADFFCVIGKRFKRQCSDTYKSDRHIPMFEYQSFDDFVKGLPRDCRVVGVELSPDAVPIEGYKHPQRAVYLLGSEDNGLPAYVLRNCHDLIRLKGERSFNVAVAGSIVAYDRAAK
jgi:tRNA(Leu) C34 or U34 (ribose-2'-O)-methylase TrmL